MRAAEFNFLFFFLLKKKSAAGNFNLIDTETQKNCTKAQCACFFLLLDKKEKFTTLSTKKNLQKKKAAGYFVCLKNLG